MECHYGCCLAKVTPRSPPRYCILCARSGLFVGVRDLDAPEAEYIQANQIPIISVEALRAMPTAVTVALERMQAHNVYLHVDTDVLEPSEFPSYVLSNSRWSDFR